MDKYFIKERIRLNIEWLRGLFALFVIIGSGTTAIFLSESFLISVFKRNIMIFGYCIDFLILIFIFIINNSIKRFINKLKK